MKNTTQICEKWMDTKLEFEFKIQGQTLKVHLHQHLPFC